MDRRENQVIFSLGSNVGNKKANLENAIYHLEHQIGPLQLKSDLYLTQSWGNEELNSFYNQVISLKTQVPVKEILHIIMEIENSMGRKRSNTNKYNNRVIDIDILFYEQEVYNEKKLCVPHPRLHLRKFVLIPLCQILPELIHPRLNKSIKKLLLECSDSLQVEKILK